MGRGHCLAIRLRTETGKPMNRPSRHPVSVLRCNPVPGPLKCKAGVHTICPKRSVKNWGTASANVSPCSRQITFPAAQSVQWTSLQAAGVSLVPKRPDRLGRAPSLVLDWYQRRFSQQKTVRLWCGAEPLFPPMPSGRVPGQLRFTLRRKRV